MSESYRTHVPFDELLELHATIGGQAFHLANMIEAIERLDPDASPEQWYALQQARLARKALDASIGELADQIKRTGTTTPARLVRLHIEGEPQGVMSVEAAARQVEDKSGARYVDVAPDLAAGITFAVDTGDETWLWVPLTPAQAAAATDQLARD